MRLTFTQFLRPDGAQRPISFRLTDEGSITKATTLLTRGYRFEVEVLRTGEISFECLGKDDSDDGDPVSVAQEICPNGPEVEHAIHKLIETAFTSASGKSS